MKGKVGDKAKIVKLCKYGADVNKGRVVNAIVTITHVFDTNSEDEHYSITTDQGYTWWYSEDEVEILKSKKVFGIDDEVMLNNDVSGFCEGTFGTVTQILGSTYFVKVSPEEGAWVEADNLEMIKRAEELDSPPTPLIKVKSDGGSSSYYQLTITNKDGETIKCETGDVIRSLVGNDFDLGNCVKALRRIYLSSIGQGKEGTELAYDCNKVRYFIGEVERVNK